MGTTASAKRVGEGHRDGMAASAKRGGMYPRGAPRRDGGLSKTDGEGHETGEGHRMGTRGHAPRKGHHWGKFTGNMGSVTGVQ